MTCFTTDLDSRGILAATLDLPDRGHNVFTAEVVAELAEIVDRVESDESIRLVVFRSGKPAGFLAGADVEQLAAIDDADRVRELSRVGQELFDRVERLRTPTLAVIHGPCLGGGLEFALACRHRVARDDASTRLGLPEVELGIVPGWGGTLRLPRQVGLSTALPMILTGRLLPASEAARTGLIDAALPAERFDDALAQFIDRLLADGSIEAVRRSWRRWFLDRTPPGRWLVLRTARRRVARHIDHYPAPAAAIEAVRQGLNSADAGLAAEREAIGQLVFTDTCRNLLSLFFGRERARNPATWVAGNVEPGLDVSTIGVVGAGQMGAAIAQLAAHRGFDVVLRDISDELVEHARQSIAGAWAKLAARGRMSEQDRAERLSRLTTTTDPAALASVDVVIEAVTEREDIKRQVFEELDRVLAPEAILATNTSSLSVTRLAGHTSRPDRVAGLHFFNPVHRMPLVEIAVTDRTDEATVARLVRLVRELGKTPLVVTDAPGFLVNRVLFGYFDEAIRMVCDGVGADEIDRDLRRFGMPMGPLELLDQVGLDVAAHVAAGLADVMTDPGPTTERLVAMVERGWLGTKSGTGFYEYAGGKKRSPSRWEGTPAPAMIEPITDIDWPERLTGIQERLSLIFINGAAGCLADGVVSEPWMADLGLVLGTGFAPFRGGPLRLATSWGIDRVTTALNQLSSRLGPRFTPGDTLVDLGDTDAPRPDTRQSAVQD